MPIGKWLRLKGYELKPNQNRAPPGSSAAYKQKANIKEEPSPPPLPPREVCSPCNRHMQERLQTHVSVPLAAS